MNFMDISINSSLVDKELDLSSKFWYGPTGAPPYGSLLVQYIHAISMAKWKIIAREFLTYHIYEHILLTY